jgi:hypothetical protein
MNAKRRIGLEGLTADWFDDIRDQWRAPIGDE